MVSQRIQHSKQNSLVLHAVLNSTRTASLTLSLNSVLILWIDLTLQKMPHGVFLHYLAALEECHAHIT